MICKLELRGTVAILALSFLVGNGVFAQNDDKGTPASGRDMAEKDSKQADPERKGADAVPPGQELVNMDFPELTDIKDIIKAVALWTGKNVILDRKISGKVQIISPRRVTKEEAYQAFLSALNVLDLTTVETGKIIKIMPVRKAVKGNLKTFLGSSYTPKTDEVITQIVPLKYIDAKKIKTTLSRVVSTNSMITYEPTNTLIISDSGYKVRRILDIIELLDVKGQQPQVAIVPIKYSDAKSVGKKVKEIYQVSQSKGKSTRSYRSYKIIVDERSNSVVIYGPPLTINEVKALVKKFDVRLDDPSKQSSIHIRPLDYADAKKLASTLSSLASAGSKNSSLRRAPILSRSKSSKRSDPVSANLSGIGSGVKITADEASNSLLITGSRAAYDAVDSIIRKLDRRRKQVFVEADILDLNIKSGFNFKSSIFAGYGNPEGNGSKIATTWEAAGVAPLVAGSAEGSTTTAKEVASAFASDMTIGVLSGAKIDIPGIGTFSPGALIKMIKTDDNTKVLASPHILTSNNEEAMISVGETVFYKTSETNPTSGTPIPKTEKENVNLTLSLKPNISNSHDVTLAIDLDADSLAGIDAATNALKINKRKTKQNVTVRNGQTVVISGLVTHREVESFSKVPLLGDIPILGWLFRNTMTESAQSSLVIFLTPHVIYGPDDLASIYKEKIKERDELIGKIYGNSGLEDNFYAKLPTLEDGVYHADQDQANDIKVEPEDKAEKTSVDSGTVAVPSAAVDDVEEKVITPSTEEGIVPEQEASPILEDSAVNEGE